jgi:uncharacterized membrane protein
MADSTLETRQSENVSVPHEQGVHLVRAITIDRPVSELFKHLSDLSKFPELFETLESIQATGPNRAHITLKLPRDMKLEFDAEIYTYEPNEVISWRSLPESEFKNAGSFRFKPAPMNRGTELQLTVEFVPPGGTIGKAFTEYFHEAPEQYIGQFLRELKQLAETGEKATTEGQSSGRKEEKEEQAR